MEQFVASFRPTRKARVDLVGRLDRLSASGLDERLLRRFTNQLRSNNELLAEAGRTSRGKDLEAVLKAIAPFNRAARRESRFARRLTLKDCA